MSKVEITPEILSTILKVINIQSGKYKVIGYEREDIEQEAFILCMEVLPRWDQTRPLENFLARHLSFRLKSLVRDKHKLQGKFADVTRKVMKAVDINSVNWDTESALISRDDVAEDVEIRDILSKVDEYLPISLRRDYLQMKAGVKINRGRAQKIKDFITALLEELDGG